MRLTLSEIEALPLAEVRRLMIVQYEEDFDAEAAKYPNPNERFWVQGISMTYTAMRRRAALRADILLCLQESEAGAEDFMHWARMPRWSGDETAALFAGLDPRKMEHVLKEVGQAAARNDRARKFGDVQAILMRGSASSFITPESYLHPVDAVEWAKRFEIDVPPTLEAAVVRLWAEPSSDSPSPSKQDIDARERASLLRIIRALDVMAKLPPRGPASSVKLQLENLGLTDGPSDATIRKWIEEARALEPDGKPQ